MKPLPSQHADLIKQAIQSAQQADDLPEFEVPDIEVKPPPNPEQGDYASPVALGLASVARNNPRRIAESIAKHMPTADFVAEVEVAGPGYINFWLSKDWLREQVDAIVEAGDDYFTLDLGAGKRAQVEFVSANPTGPLNVGRSRGAVIGDAVARILEAAGYEVEREYYFNNAGAQMRNLGESLRVRYLEALGKPVEIPAEGEKWFYRGEYLIDVAEQLVKDRGDSLVDADWEPFKEYGEQKMFEMIKGTLERIDVHHDHFFNENSLYDSGAVWEVLKELDERGYIYEAAVREGESEEVKELNKELAPAKWFRSTHFGDEQDRVLVKSNGEPTYTLPDIAYHVDKLERGFDLLVNVLGSDHFTQHQVVKYGIEALGMDSSKIHVILMQLIHIVKDGERLKMSTRRGHIELMDDLIDQTSADAMRYFLLARNPNSDVDFDVDLAVKQSNDNPVYYIQYAHVRCAGIFREADARGVTHEDADLRLLDEEELAFIRKGLELVELIEHAADNLSPHTVAFYASDLAKLFHPMYDRVRVFAEGIPEDTAMARLRFYCAVQIIFRRVLRLMGMSAPERM